MRIDRTVADKTCKYQKGETITLDAQEFRVVGRRGFFALLESTNGAPALTNALLQEEIEKLRVANASLRQANVLVRDTHNALAAENRDLKEQLAGANVVIENYHQAGVNDVDSFSTLKAENERLKEKLAESEALRMGIREASKVDAHDIKELEDRLATANDLITSLRRILAERKPWYRRLFGGGK